MSYRNCIVESIGSKHAKHEDAKVLLDQFDSRVNEMLGDGVPRERAESAAAAELIEAKTFKNSADQARRIRDAQVQIRLTDRIMKLKNRPGKELTKIYSEVEYVSRGYLGRFNGLMVDMLDKYDTRVIGAFRSKAGLDDYIKELYGKDTKSTAAKGLSEATKEMYADFARLAKAAGVDMVEDPNFHAPQMHDVGKMSKNRDKWIEDHNGDGVLDWEHMKQFNGGKIIEESDRVRVLGEVHTTITTGGLNKITFDYRPEVGVASRLTNKRFLRYKTPESWSSMQSEYGRGTLIDQLIDYMGQASRDLAQLQVLGPNPSIMKRRLEAAVKMRTSQLVDEAQTKGDLKTQKKLLHSVSRDINDSDSVFGFVTGRNADVELNNVGIVMSTIRTLLPGALLGKAIFSAAPGDIATMKSVSRLSGHKAMSPIASYLKMINPASKADREFARQMGVVNDLALGNLAAAERFGGDPFGPKWAQRLTEGALRLSLLSHHTQMSRNTFSLEMMGSYARNVNKTFDKIDFKESMERAGITAEDWDIVRQTELTDHKGAKFLNLNDMIHRTDISADVANDLFAKFTAYNQNLLEMAVPTSSVEAKSVLIGGTTAGTFKGEVLRSVAVFKNFPITIMMKHLAEGMAREGALNKGKYFVTFLAYLTAAGALSEQIHVMSRGEDPRSMNPFTDPTFWPDAVARGGGLSLFADFLTSDVNRYGGGFFKSLLGAPAAALDGFAELTVGNAQSALQGEDTKIVQQLVGTLRKIVPGSHLWYVDRAITSLVDEFILEDLDPNFQNRATKKINDLDEEGRGMWWEAGKLLPTRAPDLSSAFR